MEGETESTTEFSSIGGVNGIVLHSFVHIYLVSSFLWLLSVSAEPKTVLFNLFVISNILPFPESPSP